MDRAAFFKEISQKIGKAYSILLIFCVFSTSLLRIVNTESALVISWFFVLLALPSLCAMAFSVLGRIIDLHRHHHAGEEGYVAPSIMSLKLVPFNIVVPLVTMVPPFIIVAFIFGMDGHEQEHTNLLSAHVFLSLLAACFFWGINPFIKHMVSGASTP